MNPMEACPFNKQTGGHRLSVVVPPDVEHDIILVCERCGADKRIAVIVPTLDDQPADVISWTARVMNG